MPVPSPNEFARLLSEGIYRIKLIESKPIEVIQDELGYALNRKGGSAIEYWRRGFVPADWRDVAALAREIVVRAGVEQAWLDQFLFHGGNISSSELSASLFGRDTSPAPPADLSPDNLPGKNYRRLVGRQPLVDQILAGLADKQGRWIVAIDGQGGIGKTALARDVAERCQQQHLFDAIIWLSASRRDSTAVFGLQEGMTFERVLDAVAAQLGHPDVGQLQLAKKEQRVRELLRDRRVLLVLDNLETAVQPQEDLLQQLRPLLNPGKLLLTSRHRFWGEVFAIHLPGLDAADAVEFIHQDAADKGIGHVAAATPVALNPISQATGGSPLAMKLVVSQLAYFDVDVVLHGLAVGHTPQQSTAAYISFYRHIYSRSWSLLQPDNQNLLLAMSHFAPGIGGDFQAIQQVSALSQDDLVKSIDRLWQFSFLEVGQMTGLHHMRYYLHPLTQNFVLSDIVQTG